MWLEPFSSPLCHQQPAPKPAKPSPAAPKNTTSPAPPQDEFDDEDDDDEEDEEVPGEGAIARVLYDFEGTAFTLTWYRTAVGSCQVSCICMCVCGHSSCSACSGMQFCVGMLFWVCACRCVCVCVCVCVCACLQVCVQECVCRCSCRCVCVRACVQLCRVCGSGVASSEHVCATASCNNEIHDIHSSWLWDKQPCSANPTCGVELTSPLGRVEGHKKAIQVTTGAVLCCKQ